MATATGTVEITPRLMAEAFWQLDSKQQASFFSHLHDVVSDYAKEHKEAYSLGEMQWLYMGEDINKDAKAKEMACAFLAWVFNHSTEYLERRF